MTDQQGLYFVSILFEDNSTMFKFFKILKCKFLNLKSIILKDFLN